MANFNGPINQKSDEKANKFRESGNAEYNKNQNLEALIFYNKSISYACTKKVLSLGYANRSAVYLTLGYYEECMQNIKLARENDYPANKLSNLKEREEKCMKLMLKGEKNIAGDPWDFFKMSHPGYKNIPWIANCLDVRTTKKYGRGIYATKDLKAGDVISIEKPFISFMPNDNDDMYYKRCSNCHKSNMMNLIPCIQTASMMFCSADCMEKFYSKSIEMELALNYDMKILSEVSAPFGGYKELDKFLCKINLNDLKKTIFDFDLSNPEDPEYDKNLAMCFLSLSSKNVLFSERIHKYVSNKTANHIFSLVPLNLTANDKISNIFLFTSLINHSCLPNVFFVTIENKNVGFVTKPIKAKEQLFRCYYLKNPLTSYQEKAWIFHLHNFQCDCQECIYNNYVFKLFLLPHFIMSKKDWQLAKELLKEGWNKLNSGSQEECNYEYQNFSILLALAYYATYPD